MSKTRLFSHNLNCLPKILPRFYLLCCEQDRKLICMILAQHFSFESCKIYYCTNVCNFMTRCVDGEVVATVSAGYADGYNRRLSNNGLVTTGKGMLENIAQTTLVIKYSLISAASIIVSYICTVYTRIHSVSNCLYRMV